jgi:hypothetical protein
MFRSIAIVCVAVALAAGLGYARAGAPDAETALKPAANGEPDYAAWAVNPTVPGPDLPPAGHSLFDHLVTEDAGGKKEYRVPFPFSALTERIRAKLRHQEFGGGTRIAMIPMGRSLQRTAAAPDFFKYPRLVFAVTGELLSDEHDAGVLLKDRLYIGYVEKTDLLEVISYNEAAGRFEFQLVKDYRAGAEPKVFYANRQICIACHQNHAPIFSKPVWGETNANGRIAEMLGRQRADFYDLPPQANLDFPDDIDQATDRANALTTMQSVWREGCEVKDRAQSQRCRATAFVAVLQYALSGDQNFAAGSPKYQSDFVSTFTGGWHERWPRGLMVAQSDLPDRSPLGGGVSYGGGSDSTEDKDWIAAVNVPAALDPLNPREPRETWRFGGAMDAYRYVLGWARFFAVDDFQTLDAHLLRRARSGGAPRSAYRAPCKLTRASPESTSFKLKCAAGPTVADGVDISGSFDQVGSGTIDSINLGIVGQVREAIFDGASAKRVGPDFVLRGEVKKKGLTARLADGRALANLEIRWPAAASTSALQPIDAQVEATMLDDFAAVRAAVERLLERQASLFDSVPLRRASLMRALWSELGVSERAWCCVEDAGMPQARLDPPEVSAAAIAKHELQGFFHYCAACHLTREATPPNFLSGDADHINTNLRQCAPRMLVRLSAWQTDGRERAKSPMPPPTALPAAGVSAQQWAHGEELAGLRNYVATLLQQQGRSTDIESLLKDGYEALPACLPAAR